MNLIEYLPQFYQESNFVKSFMDSQTLEADKLKESVKDLVDNLYVKTATWGLDYFEEELGLTTDKSKSYNERRERILAKKRGNGTTTKAMLKNTAEAFSGGQVDVIEDFENYSFIVKFVGTLGIPSNINDFMNMIEEIKPCHLAYALAYTYNTWQMLADKKLTWGDLSNKTWNEARVYEGVMINETN